MRRASSAVGMPSAAAVSRHLQAVHVGAGEEPDVEAVEPLEPRDRVGGDVFVGVPDVRVAVGVGDGGGDVVRLAHLVLTLLCGGERRSVPASGAAAAPEPLAPLIDAHTHLDACGAIDADDVRAIVDRAAAVGVRAVVTIADDLASARWVARGGRLGGGSTPPSRCTRPGPTR